jgi:hypothetical protein
MCFPKNTVQHGILEGSKKCVLDGVLKSEHSSSAGDSYSSDAEMIDASCKSGAEVFSLVQNSEDFISAASDTVFFEA